MDTHAPLSTREYLVPIRNHTEALISGRHSFNGFLYRYCKGTLPLGVSLLVTLLAQLPTWKGVTVYGWILRPSLA